jgi:succinate dehydrogenase / fumarate reductase iron-sulfur subunit
MPVIKDLVVDMQLFWDQVRAVTPWLQPTGPTPEREFLAPNSAMLELSGVMNCIMCGACVSDCTVLEVDKHFLGPAALAKAYRFIGDPRDGQDEKRLRDLNGDGGIWDCTRCNYCVEVCPKGVRPMDRIMQLREAAAEAGVRDSIGYRHGKAFADSVKVSGRLNEASVLPRSVGMFNAPRLLEEIPGAVRLAMARKLPWKHSTPLHKPIPGYKSVRRLMNRARREKKQKEVTG